MPQLFISYSRKDIAFVRRLAGDLENAGFTVWWDVSDLRGGDDWVRVIPEAIEASDTFIVVLSPNSAVSEWVRKEYTQALYLRKRIIPVMLARTTVPFALNTINYIDFTAEDEYAASLNALLRDLGYTGEPVTPASTRPLLLRRLAVPLLVSLAVLLILAAVFVFNPPVPSTPTPTPTTLPSTTPSPLPSATATVQDTPTPSPTGEPTATVTPTVTQTFTPQVTATPSITRTPSFERLQICVSSLYANSINVRSGPGIIYAPIGAPLPVDTCLFFRGQNAEGTWLLIAPGQTDPDLRQYEGGWIYWELLGQSMPGLVDLPVVTLTPTPLPSDTPTVTPTFTPSPTPTLTPTAVPSDSPTPEETDTPAS
jgi:hypothetical protein